MLTKETKTKVLEFNPPRSVPVRAGSVRELVNAGITAISPQALVEAYGEGADEEFLKLSRERSGRSERPSRSVRGRTATE